MMTHPYASWSPATDTHEIPSALRGNPPTVELHLLDLRPTVPAAPRRRVRQVLARIARSASLRGSLDTALATAGIVAAAVLCTRGAAFLAAVLLGGAQ